MSVPGGTQWEQVMNGKKLRAFLTRITTDPELREDLEKAITERDDKEAAAAEVADRYGFEVNIQELRRLMDGGGHGPEGELADEELEAVAGGLTFFQALARLPPFIPQTSPTQEVMDPIQLDSNLDGTDLP